MNWLNDFYFLKITTHIFTKWPEASLPWTYLRSLCSWQLFKFNKEHSKTIRIWNVWYNYKFIIIIIYYYINNIIGKFSILHSIILEKCWGDLFFTWGKPVKNFTYHVFEFFQVLEFLTWFFLEKYILLISLLLFGFHEPKSS